MREVKKALCLILAIGFSVFGLYILDWVIFSPLQRYAFSLPPSSSRLALDGIGATFGFGILLSSIPVTVKNYRHLKRLLLEPMDDVAVRGADNWVQKMVQFSAPGVVYAFLLVTLVAGIDSISKGAVYEGIAGIIGTGLCSFAGSGLKGSLILGAPAEKLFGRVATLAFVAVGIALVYHSGWWLGLFGFEVAGATWCVIGFGVSYLCTTKKFVEEMDGPSKVGSTTEWPPEQKVVAVLLVLAFGRIIWTGYGPVLPIGTSVSCADDATVVRYTCNNASKVSKAAATQLIISGNPMAPGEKAYIQDLMDRIYKSKADGMSCADMVSLYLQSCQPDEKK